MANQSFLAHFLNVPFAVSTPVGPVIGVLLWAYMSEHGSIGNLLLQTYDAWTIVKEWIAVKRRI